MEVQNIPGCSHGWCELGHEEVMCSEDPGGGSEGDQAREVGRWASPERMFLFCVWVEFPAESF